MTPRILGSLAACLLATTTLPASAEPVFNRVASFPVVTNLPADRDRNTQSVAEIIAATADGMMLAYTDADQKALGLIDIADPTQPKPAGFVPLGGEPTSVAIGSGKALVAVVTSPSFDKPSGHIAVIDLARKTIDAICEVGGQPDSVKLTADGRTLAIAMENERDEKKDKGKLPQLPAGNLTLIGFGPNGLDCGSKRVVDLTGLAEVAPEDPEPEFVDVNSRGEAVVTIQENNHIAVVDVASGKVTKHFSAGAVTLDKIDSKRDGIIAPVDRLENVKREPDAVAWLDDDRFVTANEGDYEGGSRGFTIFRKDGTVEFDSGSSVDHIAMRHGHYPERRSAAKGSEPEGVAVGQFGSERLFFVGLERASLALVYRDNGPGRAPDFLQALPTSTAPEGLIAIPSRNLLVVTGEVDAVKDGLGRSHVSIYRRAEGTPTYPSIVSVDGPDGIIPWGALSGLSADRTVPGKLYAVTDSAYAHSRILEIDATAAPAKIVRALTVMRGGKPAGLDLEGIATRPGGGFWLASEGNPERKDNPVGDILLRVAADGSIEDEVTLPEVLTRHGVRFGFEGVTVTGQGADEAVWIAVQREWKDDPKGKTKILRYHPATKAWGVLHYPLEPAAPGAWMGLSEITALGDDRFAVIERDNLFGDAAVKTLKTFSVKGLVPAALGATEIPTVKPLLWRDLVPDLKATGGPVLDKVEGFTVDTAGNAFVVTDNDGVDNSSGETRFLRLGKLPN